MERMYFRARAFNSGWLVCAGMAGFFVLGFGTGRADFPTLPSDFSTFSARRIPFAVNLKPCAALPSRYPLLLQSLQRLLTTAESGHFGYFLRENRLGNNTKQAEIISSELISAPALYRE